MFIKRAMLYTICLFVLLVAITRASFAESLVDRSMNEESSEDSQQHLKQRAALVETLFGIQKRCVGYGQHCSPYGGLHCCDGDNNCGGGRDGTRRGICYCRRTDNSCIGRLRNDCPQTYSGGNCA
ncbi:unnamed protein product [Adineta ricciae]|uniref:Uncharacterized protein n=1 Tax=Adineta ricciae TaxID=249248 RepID=A0A815SLS1_ADIRI|nr:unnamed protein product [Adineta ricciae]CAF1492411.1 unnamed protein product [Adineta ricciae]